ncbi:uncharacterized protein FTOL_10760 [Fusarium torulosum]|uniref:Uncharacterized protein n=1 Tax=Fusarium torulosum TaxID=33205 RepID=A0AAE8MHF9_9HYPO|nr:uncharacterized protein FTOL_10760 [Fusarium torulosum]
MPVTIKINTLQAGQWKTASVKSPEDLLEQTSPRDFKCSQKIINSSPSGGTLREQNISASTNGFVKSAIQAYSNHYHLIIRPEDIWFAIILQLSFYMNANAEKLRHLFVTHQGKKKLTVLGIESGSSLEQIDFGSYAQKMVDLIDKNIHDRQLADWVMPDFSTTTFTDRSIAAVLFMSSMQEYFEYQFMLKCGIPSVTLLGQTSDWIKILGKLAKLEEFGDEPKLFAQMLRLILYHLVLSFEQPDSAKVTDFWNTIVTKQRRGSGTSTLTGWITAFCYWNAQGEANQRLCKDVLDGVSYPVIATCGTPIGFGSVPVTISDGSNEQKCVMLAGSIGIQAQAIDDKKVEAEHVDGIQKKSYTGIQPVSGWLMYECEGE